LLFSPVAFPGKAGFGLCLLLPAGRRLHGQQPCRAHGVGGLNRNTVREERARVPVLLRAAASVAIRVVQTRRSLTPYVLLQDTGGEDVG